MAYYPTLHKFLALGLRPAGDFGQILYLDCDTFFLGDVEVLFELYQENDFYAREERFGPEHLDEGALAWLRQRESLQPVMPFNSGVCLMNHGIWNRFEQLETTFLDTTWRLLAGFHLAGDETSPFDPDLRAAVNEAANLFDRARALSYPSRNHWIIEQIGWWLALGHLPRFSQGWLSRNRVAQSSEYPDASRPDLHPVLAHYFSNNQAGFFAELGRLHGADFPLQPAV